MNRKKHILVVSFALFSLFFGAGNLILPPQLGFKAGNTWIWVTIGFALSAVLIPVFGILAHAKLQGTLFDIGKKVSPTFSLVYCYLIYAISITLPSPRTASVTHEMGIAPLFDGSPWITSTIYFALVFVFVINRSKILNIIGKFLTPAIITMLLAIIGMAFWRNDFSYEKTLFTNPFAQGMLEGYQTFDAIGAVVVGGVIIISVNLQFKELSSEEKRGLIAKAGTLAGLGLLLIYTGLIMTGALMQGEYESTISRTALLSGISLHTLGNAATFFLSALVGLACFTTAVGIVAGTSDFIKGRFHNSHKAYTITALIGCVLGVLMGQLKVDYIIAVAIPALMFIYPLTIILILLHLVPEKYGSPKVFQWVVLTTFVFSIPDFLGSVGLRDSVAIISEWIPLSKFHLGWALPAVIAFALVNAFKR